MHTHQQTATPPGLVHNDEPPASKQDAYDYLPDFVLARLPRLYATESQDDPVAQVKYFLPEGRLAYYAIEYSQVAPDETPDLFFGYLVSPLGPDCNELCYMTLEQIKSLRSPTLNLPVERDLWFRPAPLSEIKHPHDRDGRPDRPPEPSTGQAPAIAGTAPQQELAFADDGQSVSFSNAEYRIAAAYVQRGENRYSPGWKIYRHEADSWTALEEDKPTSEAEWKQSLTLSDRTAQLINIAGCAIHLIGKPDDLPDSYPYVSEGVVLAAQKQGATLPDGWTADDLRFLLDRLERGPILVSGAGEHLGIPTIHNFDPRAKGEHIGMGVIKARTPEYTIVFDAGSEMSRTPSGHGYTRVDVRAGVFPYDTEGVRAKLEAWLQVAEERAKAEPEPRRPAFGDWVRTPDGEIVQMRGSGGMGSNRVGGYDRDGRQVGWYDRDEQVFVSETMPVEPEAQVTAPSPQPARPNPYLHQSTVQLNRELKRIDKELKSLNARQDVAYDMAINDRGESLRRLQREIDAVLERRQQVVDALLSQQKPQAEPTPEPPQPEPFSTTLAAWLDDEHHETQRSGGDMYYIRSDGERVLWPGTTSRYEAVVCQHRCEVERTIVEGHPITGDVLNEYPDLAVQADEKGLTRPPADATYRPVWMRTRREFSVSHPMSAAGVPIGKVDAAKERYHEIVVAQAVERGYPVPERVLESYPQFRQAVVAAPTQSLTPIGEWDIGWETWPIAKAGSTTCSRCQAQSQASEDWYRGWKGNHQPVYLCPSCQATLHAWSEEQLEAKMAGDQARLCQARIAQIAKWQEILAGKPLACKHPNKVCSEAPTRIATISEGEHTVEMTLCESCCDEMRSAAKRGGYQFTSRKIGPVAGTQAGSEARKPSYTNDDVAAYEGWWDVYLETGSLATVRKTVKRIDSAGVLRVAFERADRGPSASTLEERRKIIQQRIRQLEKAA